MKRTIWKAPPISPSWLPKPKFRSTDANFVVGLQLLIQGASWGAVNDNDFEGCLADIAKPRINDFKMYTPPQKHVLNCSGCGIEVNKLGMRGLCKDCTPVGCLGGCGLNVHSNPPPKFSEEERKYCCGWCHKQAADPKKRGKHHGENCQKIPFM